MTLIFGFIVMPSNAKASEEQDYFTIEGYEEYLQNLISTDDNSSELASEGLEQFKKLSVEEQETYLKFLQSNEYIEVLEEALAEQPSNDSETKDFTIEFNNMEIPIRLESTGDAYEEKPAAPFARAAAATEYEYNVTAVYKLYALKINTTNIMTHLKFKGNGNRATKVLDGYHDHTNINPGVWVSYVNEAKTYIEGNYAYVRASYELRANASLGFLSSNLHHTVRARWSGSKEHMVESSHANISGHGWTAF